MAKSFKRVIACLLAVLMVCFSMPFTALAAPGDYAPDVQLQFGTFYDTASGSWTDIGTASAGSSFDYCGIYDAKVDYNYTKNADGSISGNLTLAKANADQAAEVLGCDSIDADYAYGVGDYFTVTVLFTNVTSNVAVIQSVLTYSENIEPAGLYSYKSGRNTAYAFGTETERAAKSGTWVSAGTNPIYAQGQASLYPDQGTYGGFGDSSNDTSYVNTENHYINAACVSQVTGTDVSSTSAPDPTVPFTNPETGDMLDGYTYTNTVVADTFAFKIVDEGDITFGVWDTDNSKHSEGNYSGGYYFSNAESGATTTYTTYATNADATAPGSMKMTIFGMNVNSGQGLPGDDTEEHKHTYTAVTTDPTCEEDGYITYTCNNEDGLGTEGDDVYTEGADLHPELAAIGHDYKGVVTPPTCTEQGYTTYTCTHDATHTYVGDYVAATGHTPGDAVQENVVEATEDAAGSYDEVVYCTVCGAELSRTSKEIPKLDHVHVYVDTVVPPTCTEQGYTIHTCEKGDDEYIDTYVDALGHTPAAAVKENEVAATKTTDGSYDSVVYCSVCGDELSRETITVPATGIIVTVNNTYENYGNVDADYGENAYPYLSTVTLTATPVSGAEFVGWEVSGKKISDDPVLTFTATSDVTVTPIFADTTDNITVVFLDKYDNVVYSYAGTVADFAAAMAEGIPTGTSYPGYTFDSWDITDEEILAINKSTTVYGNYTATGNTYKVVLDGEGTIDGEAVTEKDVTYDSPVTVQSDSATAWIVDNQIVSYGDTYTFFVGSNITVTPVTETVTAKPEVGMVGTTVTSESAKNVNYLATMTVPDGYTLLDHGFVYVADKVGADVVTLDNVGTKASNGKVVKKVTGGATGTQQFALNYSVTSTQYATVTAYIVYQAEDGSVTTAYTTPTVFDYTNFTVVA